jgi:hypothetical protein
MANHTNPSDHAAALGGSDAQEAEAGKRQPVFRTASANMA